MAMQRVSIIEMRQERAGLWEQAKALHDKSVTEKRAMDGSEQEQYDRIMKDVDRLKGTIDREERILAEETELEARNATPPARQEDGEKRQQKPLETPEYRQAYLDWAKFGMEGLNPEQRQLLAHGRQTVEQRALSGLTGAAGGFTVPTDFYNQLVTAMKAFGGMRQSRATVLRTSAGNDLPLPNADDTANKAVIVGESAAVGLATDPVFGQKILKAYKYTSKTILVPIELLQDSAFDLEAYLRNAIAERFGRGTNEHFTVGTGGGTQPTGIVTASTQGKVGATGQTTAIAYDDLVDLEHSVDPAYRALAEYMFHDNTLRALKKLKDSQGRPLWLPGVALNAPDKILDYTYIINQDMPQMAANAKSVLFGDMSKYFIRDVMDLMFVRIAEKYIENGQIGFLAFSRHDGTLNDVTNTTAVRHYANSAT